MVVIGESHGRGLPSNRDALMAIAWGLSLRSRPFSHRVAELRARGMAPIRARVAVARHVPGGDVVGVESSVLQHFDQIVDVLPLRRLGSGTC